MIKTVDKVNNKCSDRNVEVELSAFLGNYDKPGNHPTNQQTKQQTDGREGSKGIYISNKQLFTGIFFKCNSRKSVTLAKYHSAGVYESKL